MPRTIAATLICLTTAACATPDAAPSAVPATEVASRPVLTGPMWQDSEHVLATCDRAVKRSEQRVAAVIANPPTKEADLQLYDRMLREVDGVRSTAELVAAVHPDHSVRGAAEVCERALGRLGGEIASNTVLFGVMSKVDTKTMSTGAQRFVQKVLRSARRAGVDKDRKIRARLRDLDAEILQRRQNYSRRIRESRGWIAVSSEALAGLPPDFVARHPADAQGLVELTTDYSDFFPVLTYAHEEALRRNLYRAFLNRAYPDNGGELKALLSARHEYATLLGYPSWTAFMAEDQMLDSPKGIHEFVDTIAEAVRPQMQAELTSLLARKKRDDRRAEAVEVWDRFYYVRQAREEKHDFDASAVRKYFEVERTVMGVLDVYAELFGLRFEPEDGVRTWHHSVRVFNAYEGDWLLGRFFLDMHPRPDKYEHASMFPMTLERGEGQLPSAALVCNFPNPHQTKSPALLDHAQVRSLFHEFAHVVHFLLAAGQPWSNQASTSVELDFRETTSQLLEEWAWRPEVLRRFAQHIETEEPIPTELVEKMRASHELGRGVHLMRQVYYTALSARLHEMDPRALDLAGFQAELMKRYSPYPNPAGTHGYASFNHLDGYSSMYYVYQWSLSLSKDMLTRFEEDGFLNPELTKAFADAVLRPGGSKPARELTEAFLGRPPSLDAYRRWLARP